MDCIEAQELVSAALDHETVDDEPLAIAKQHCRDCADCAIFVRSLVAVQRAPLPEPSDDLADRIMGTIHAERARAERAAVAIETTRRSTDVQAARAVRSDIEAANVVSLKERLLHPRNRRALAAWSSAAAVALVAAGIGAVYGARAILTDRAEPQTFVLESGGQPEESVGMTFGNATDTQSGASKDAAASVAYDTTGLIVVDGAVYKAAGPDSSVTRATLSPRGSTRTSLESGRAASEREVLGTDDPARVFVEADDKTMLAFDRVTTSHEGRTYVLQSGPLGEWGSAAVLPNGMTEPVTKDGSPTFEPLGSSPDPTVFVLRGKDATYGIALPPGARADVAQGWSWWLPVAR